MSEVEVILLTWKSQIGKRVASPTIKVETIGQGEAMEIAVFLREIGKEFLCANLGIIGSTDNKTLLEQ